MPTAGLRDVHKGKLRGFYHPSDSRIRKVLEKFHSMSLKVMTQLTIFYHLDQGFYIGVATSFINMEN